MKGPQPSQTAVARTQWVYEVETNKLTGIRTHMAISPIVFGEPYKWAVLKLQCEEDWISSGEMVFRFLNPKNIFGFESKKRTRIGIRFNKETTEENAIDLTQPAISLCGRSLLFGTIATPDMMAKAGKSDWVEFRIDYHNYGIIVIRMTLQGAKTAIEKVIRNSGKIAEAQLAQAKKSPE